MSERLNIFQIRSITLKYALAWKSTSHRVTSFMWIKNHYSVSEEFIDYKITAFKFPEIMED